jgi:hypothetical protein
MAQPTKQQLQRFVTKRNKSGFASNLQFAFDAKECGFDVEDLGQAHRLETGGYRWSTGHGHLIERPDGSMELVSDECAQASQ